MQKGSEASGYTFIVYRQEEQVLGYACYGPRALTYGTYDLYWIAVDSTRRQGGVGRALLAYLEQSVHGLGGHLVFVETSGTQKYEATRRFYLATGYTLEATIRDFYAPGDDLVIFTRHV